MLRAYAADYVRLIRIFEEIGQVMEQASTRHGTLMIPMTDVDAQKMKRLLESLEAFKSMVALPVFQAQAERIENALDDDNEQEAFIIWGQLRHILEAELESHQFLYVKPDLARFYGGDFQAMSKRSSQRPSLTPKMLENALLSVKARHVFFI